MSHRHRPARSLVLVVDDHRDSREGLAEYLRFAGFNVVVAVDGAEGLAVATRRHPDVILMDLKLRGIDGWEVTRRLKSQWHTRNIPVVAVSACVFDTDIEAAKQAGCAAFVIKPFNLRQLVRTVERALSGEGFPDFVLISTADSHMS